MILLQDLIDLAFMWQGPDKILEIMRDLIDLTFVLQGSGKILLILHLYCKQNARSQGYDKQKLRLWEL